MVPWAVFVASNPLQLDHVLSDMVSGQSLSKTGQDLSLLQLDHVLSDMVRGNPEGMRFYVRCFNWTMSFQTW